MRLLPNDELLVVAPCGLSDLFTLTLHRNPRRVSLAEYRRRIQEKRIRDKWPRVQIVAGFASDSADPRLPGPTTDD